MHPAAHQEHCTDVAARPQAVHALSDQHFQRNLIVHCTLQSTKNIALMWRPDLKQYMLCKISIFKEI
jgi:hypothetical protein